MHFYILILFCFVQYKLLISADYLGQVVISPNKSLYQLDKSGASILLIEKKEIEEDLQFLKEEKIKQLKKNTHRKLSETDWYIIREYETHIPVPYEVKMFRMELRDKVEQYEKHINSLQDKFQVLAFNVSID